MKHRKVIINGYWKNNLGDDLFLKVFSEAQQKSELYIQVEKRYRKRYIYKNVRLIIIDAFSYRILRKIRSIIRGKILNPFYRIKDVTSCIFLGGSLFMEEEGWRQQIVLMEEMVEFSKESYVIGSNFGPFSSEIFLDTYMRIFQRFNVINFRETKSCTLFATLTNVAYAPDPVLSLNFNSIRPLESDLDYYVISNINIEHRKKLSRYMHEYELRLAQVADELITRGKAVVFMSFCSFEEDEVSIYRIIRLMKRYRNDQVKVYIHREIDESLMLISGCKGIVATRFHAMILSFVMNIPVFPICYSDKMQNVIHDYQYKGSYCSLQNLSDTDMDVILEALFIKPNIPRKIFEQSKEALKYEY